MCNTTVVMRGYLHYCHLPASFNQSGPSPLTSLIKNAVLPAERLLTGCVSFFPPLSANSRDSWKSQISGFQNTHTTQSGTHKHFTVKVNCITFIFLSDIWYEKQLNLLTMSAHLCVFSCCHINGWLNISIYKSLIHWSLRVQSCISPWRACSWMSTLVFNILPNRQALNH